MEQKNNNLTEKILKKIKSGEVKARPKVFFLAKAAGFIALSIVSFLIAVFLASFVAFALPLGGLSLLLTILAFTALLFIVLNIFLAEKFPSFYKKPLLFGLIIFLLLTAFSAWLVLNTPFHAKVLEYSKENKIPIISPLYKCGCGCGCSQQNICECSQGKCHMPLK